MQSRDGIGMTSLLVESGVSELSELSELEDKHNEDKHNELNVVVALQTHAMNRTDCIRARVVNSFQYLLQTYTSQWNDWNHVIEVV